MRTELVSRLLAQHARGIWDDLADILSVWGTRLSEAEVMDLAAALAAVPAGCMAGG
jgi:hypothetical protein